MSLPNPENITGKAGRSSRHRRSLLVVLGSQKVTITYYYHDYYCYCYYYGFLLHYHYDLYSMGGHLSSVTTTLTSPRLKTEPKSKWDPALPQAHADAGGEGSVSKRAAGSTGANRVQVSSGLFTKYLLILGRC